MPVEQEVFSKIRELSSHMVNPRPQLNILELALELGWARDKIMPSLLHLKKLRLININGLREISVRLTLLGSVCQQG
jgi:hypothetical protein